MKKDKVFLSWNGHAIWYRVIDGDITYMVARGDGTDEYFTDWEEAIKYIDKRWSKK